MKNLNLIPLTDSQREKITTSFHNYKRFKIEMSILEVKDKTITLRIEQKDIVNDKLLTQKELIIRAKNAFLDIPEGWKVNVRALTYKGDFGGDLTLEDINRELEKRNIKQVDLTRYLQIDKSALNKLLKGETGLTRSHKAMFYYFFKWMDAAS